jgi:hypothetical protein
MALALFVRLPPDVREAWLKISTIGSEQQLKTLMDKMAAVNVSRPK